MSKEEEKKESVNLDKIISNKMFNAIIEILSSRQRHFMKELNDRFETKKRTNIQIDELKERGASDKQVENLKYFQQRIFESTDADFKDHYKEEFVHQKEVIEFLNTFTNDKWQELEF